MEQKPNAGAAVSPGARERTAEEKAAALAGAKRELAAAVARWEELLVEQRSDEHRLEGPAAEELDREIWRVVARMLVLAGAIGKAEGGEGRLPGPILTIAGKQLEAAFQGFVAPGLRFKKKGNADSPFKRRAVAVAVEYLSLVEEGYLRDEHAIKTIRQIFNDPTRKNYKSDGSMLDWSTVDDWRRKHPATGVLRRRIEQAERDGALGSRGEIARKLLEEYAVRMSAKRTGI